MASAQQWKDLLDLWTQKLECRWGELVKDASDWGLTIEPGLSSVMRQGCSSEELSGLEHRLQVELPPSYKTFLMVSNGAYLLERPFKLLSSEDVGWFEDIDPKLVNLWEQASYTASDEEYFTYGRFQDSVHMRSEYIRKCLLVSSSFEGDQYLLNPEIISDTGEWEAMDLGHRNPGAKRYRSFWDLMNAGYSNIDGYLG